ncbi:iron-siderophore ABC transporter substrate-binding protein [Streptomyces sp. NP160]|uniref:ABC transporter substrate-binding protein n=1 Tax=Streptomyces sp. NP160 TaxID=2586637 RepID=UPI00111800D0|nr:iron-siderophore ABC transporter substrate-binding protein [Streptomyces sp. NP160]TNM69644.1 iron-siderophore ABC transporter substrate-binding protein [Streptomyces sp. NP160]
MRNEPSGRPSVVPAWRLGVAAAAAAALLAGCGGGALSGSQAGAPAAGASDAAASPSSSVPDNEAGATGQHVVSRTMADGMGSTQADGVFPRTVAHYLGTTEVPAAPQRIAVVSTGQLDALLTLGHVPVAATVAESNALVPEYLAQAFTQDSAALGAMASTGTRTEPDVEAIAQAGPDLILINSTRGKDYYAALSAIAPTVVTLGNGVNWKSDFLLLADALGQEGDAQEVLDGLHADADAYAVALPAGQPAPTVSFLQSTGDRTRIMGLPSFTGGVAEDLGLGRPASQQFDETSQDISAEQLDLADADWVFFAAAGDGAQLVQGSALWPGLSAVQAGHAVEVPLEPFYLNAGPTAARLVQDTLTTTVTP